ncbi:AAA domain-containing protein [Nocardia xishanensis]|uniref:AAA domain-containing protein n=1 Tax=Nocardia xishanensis TaxID=238964 RepID=UPI00082F04EA|nr:AAA domain-containing protein [Nocardia xishanensis]
MGWREEVVTALGAWLEAEGGGGDKPRWRRIGRAVRAAEEGMFSIDVRGLNINADQVQADSLRLAGPDESSLENSHAVMDVSQDGSTLRVRVAEFVDPSDPTLWLYQQPPTFLIESLRKGIAAINEDGLAGSLARGELAGTLAPIGTAADVLTPAQNKAYRACRGSGLWLVWGPPGTGKTSVLKRAISDLIADGRRVLLVSATNIAVDNALAGVVRENRHGSGQLVRVGPPHLREVAENREVCLPLLVRDRLSDVERRRAELAAEITEITVRKKRLDALDAALVDFDAVTYIQASTRLSDPEFTVEHMTAEIEHLTERHRVVSESLPAAELRVETATERETAVSTDRRIWAQVEELSQEAANLAQAAAKAKSDAAVAEASVKAALRELSRLHGQPPLNRLRQRAALAEAKQKLQAAEDEHAHLAESARTADSVATVRRAEIALDIDRLTRRALIDRRTLDRIAAELREATATATVLRSNERTYSARLRLLHSALRESSDAAEIVAEAARRGYPDRYRDAAELRPQVTADNSRHAALVEQHRKIQQEYEQLAKDAQGEIIRSARLVATTLARFRTNIAVFEGPYDVVLVDEVGAATLPEVLLAVSVARTTAVLLGDFLQLGPVFSEKLRMSRRTDVRRWLLTEVFQHCRINSPAAAQGHDYCITLQAQHRFGVDVMELANTLAYGGVLTAGEVARARQRFMVAGDAEIVIIDTDGLGELAQIYRLGRAKGWWPAGMLLARALADLHYGEGNTVGVVTPYSAQADATLEALREIESPTGTIADVGTAHRFQGREFGVVIFDLVESALGSGMWMAKARRSDTDDWQNSGLRLFNVAVTRVQQRLYLIGSRNRILAASPDSALGAVRSLIEARRVRTIPAAHLVAPVGDSASRLGPFGSQLAEVLGRHVEISSIEDEDAFYEFLGDRLARARHSIWIWSPWVAKRVRSLLPALDAAQRRGVRITIFVRDPKSAKQPTFPAFVNELKAVTPTVIAVNYLHQKIIVIDEKLVLLGSLNTLSQSHSREVMVAIHGSHFARRVLDHEHAEDFAKVPLCPHCGTGEVDLRRYQPRDSGPHWRWHCYNEKCPGRKGNRAWTTQIALKSHNRKQRSRD